MRKNKVHGIIEAWWVHKVIPRPVGEGNPTDAPELGSSNDKGHTCSLCGTYHTHEEIGTFEELEPKCPTCDWWVEGDPEDKPLPPVDQVELVIKYNFKGSKTEYWYRLTIDADKYQENDPEVKKFIWNKLKREIASQVI